MLFHLDTLRECFHHHDWARDKVLAWAATLSNDLNTDHRGHREHREMADSRDTAFEERDPLTGAVLGAALEVHRELGPGLLESAYEECLCWELAERGLAFRRQVPLPVVYKTVHLDAGYRLDVVVEGQVIVEIKSVESLTGLHEAQLLTYLKLSGLRRGLLLNFNTQRLCDGIRRRVL